MWRDSIHAAALCWGISLVQKKNKILFSGCGACKYIYVVCFAHCLFGLFAFMRFYETCLAADGYEYQTDVAHFCMHDFPFGIAY